MTELMEAGNRKARKTESFCLKVATYLLNKALPKVWKKVNELKNEEIERSKMAIADTFSRVVERKYREELEQAKRRFLSQKAVEYKRWVKQDKAPIFAVEKFDKVRRLNFSLRGATRADPLRAD
jgi:hypothetical protein